jgi:hypothetical protein
VKWIGLIGIPFLAFSATLAQTGPPAESVHEQPRHDREFWRTIAKNRYAAPTGQPVFPLLRELSGYLGSRDPELRDDLAYTITAVWIKHQPQLSADELNSLLDEWRANLRVGVGESGTDTVLKRSFSALCLAALAERDLKSPFLTEERYRTLLADALTYLKDERDLRGFDPTLGWIHATAHTSDLLTALAANPLFRSEDQGHVLNAISGRLVSAHEIFMYGEQDRLALVAATIAQRKDVDSGEFHAWLNALDSDQRVWKDSPPNLELLQIFENDTYMLRGLAVYLYTSPAKSVITNLQNDVTQLLQRR